MTRRRVEKPKPGAIRSRRNREKVANLEASISAEELRQRLFQLRPLVEAGDEAAVPVITKVMVLLLRKKVGGDDATWGKKFHEGAEASLRRRGWDDESWRRNEAARAAVLAAGAPEDVKTRSALAFVFEPSYCRAAPFKTLLALRVLNLTLLQLRAVCASIPSDYAYTNEKKLALEEAYRAFLDLRQGEEDAMHQCAMMALAHPTMANNSSNNNNNNNNNNTNTNTNNNSNNHHHHHGFAATTHGTSARAPLLYGGAPPSNGNATTRPPAVSSSADNLAFSFLQQPFLPQQQQEQPMPSMLNSQSFLPQNGAFPCFDNINDGSMAQIKHAPSFFPMPMPGDDNDEHAIAYNNNGCPSSSTAHFNSSSSSSSSNNNNIGASSAPNNGANTLFGKATPNNNHCNNVITAASWFQSLGGAGNHFA